MEKKSWDKSLRKLQLQHLEQQLEEELQNKEFEARIRNLTEKGKIHRLRIKKLG